MLLESKNPDRNGVLWGIRIHFNVSVMLFRVLHNEIGRTSNSFITHMTLEYHKVNANTFLFSLNLRAPILKCQCWSNFHILEFFCILRKTVGVEFSKLLSWSQIDTFNWSNEIASFTVFRNGPQKHILGRISLLKWWRWEEEYNTLLNCWSWKVLLIYSNSWPSGFSETDEKTFDFLRKLSSRQSVSLPIAYWN